MSARLLALVVAFVVIGPATQALAEAAGVTAGPAAWAGEPQLEITGSAPDLVPGHPVLVEVRISNPRNSGATIRVTKVTATVSAAGPGCMADNVRITSYHWTAKGQNYSASPGTTVVVPLTMTLIETGKNQDACQGVSFPIHFSVDSSSR
jgi:hypothetical protein